MCVCIYVYVHLHSSLRSIKATETVAATLSRSKGGGRGRSRDPTNAANVTAAEGDEKAGMEMGGMLPGIDEESPATVVPSAAAEAEAEAEVEADHYGIFGTPEWMAPEVMEGQKYNEKIDVYSYGILLTELLTRQLPFHDMYHITCYADVAELVVEKGAIPSIPLWADTFLVNTHVCISICLHLNTVLIRRVGGKGGVRKA